MTSTLLADDVGVILKVIAVSINEDEVADVCVFVVMLTTCKIFPAPIQLNAPEPLVLSTCPLDPLPVGSTSVFDPATAGASISV
jgi:hypothetical protein